MIEDNIFNQSSYDNQSQNNGCYPPWYYAYLNGADLPYGFQDMNPDYLNAIAFFVGAVLSSNLPFNLQNFIGNWLQLAGQYIETYNAQQQYFQSGPGRFYEPQYRNINNPFVPENEPSETGGSALGNTETQSGAAIGTSGQSGESSQVTLEQLQQEIAQLRQQIADLKRKI